MRILVIGEYYRPLIGWFQRDDEPTGTPAIYNLYQYLGNTSEHQFYSIIYNYDCNRIKKMPNGSIIELKKLSFPIYLIWKLIAFFKLYFYINRHLRDQQYDLLYGLSTYASIAAILGRKYKTPSLGRIYGTILTEKLKNKRWFKIYTRHIFELLAIKLPTDYMIATQDGTAFDKVAKYFNPELEVKMMYNGMEDNYRKTLLSLSTIDKIEKTNRINICSISRLEPYKRHHINIAIAKILKEEYDLDVHLSIVGTGSLLEEIKNLISDEGAQSYVKLKAEIPHKDLPNLVSGYDISMFMYEGGSLGNVMWEHALAGRTICTVDNGETCMVFRDGVNALVVHDGHNIAQDMASKIYDYIQQGYYPLAHEARATVKNLIGTWDERFANEFNWIKNQIQDKG